MIYPRSAAPASTIADAFRKIVRDTPQRRLLYLPATDRTVTAEQLARSAAAVGTLLRGARIPRGATIAAALGNRPAAFAGFLACVEAGHPYLPVDVSTSPQEVASLARRFDAAGILSSAAEPLVGFTDRIALPGGGVLAVADREPAGAVHDAAVMKLTSGTTGLPRATLTSEAALVSDTRTLMDAMGVTADDVQIAAIPLSHAYGFGNLLVPVLLQGTAIVLREAFVPHRIPEDARAVGARVFPGVPFMFDFFNDHPPSDGWPPSLTTLMSAGARLERETIVRFREAFGVKVHSFYGTTETGGICYDDSDDDVPEGMVGRPLAPVSVTLVPHDGAPPGSGRVHVRGPSVITSYADGIDHDVFVEGGFLTGDLGSFDARGRLILSSRVSRFVNVAGRKVQPAEVEQVLREHTFVADVRVLGMVDSRRGEQLVAFIVMRGRDVPTTLELRQFCARRLASYKIPRLFVALDRIPLTERGKTDRAALEAAAERANAGML